ncbi:MAG: hypothetical protein P8188_09220 [Gemmatimonadota bacterium]
MTPSLPTPRRGRRFFVGLPALFLAATLPLTAQEELARSRAPGMGTGGATASAAAVDPQVMHGLNYRLVGPTQGGRVTAVAGHRAHPGTFYMGATGGGVWKTTDWGVTWLPVSDGYLATGSIGAIRVAPSNPDRVYVGTGSDGIRSNVILGRGAYRSDDAGATWQSIGLREVGQIGAVEIHPRDPDVAFAAALGNPFRKNEDRGLYRTRDAGRTWDRVLFTSDSVGAIDVELHPTNPDVVYASMWRGERKPWSIISGMEESAREDGIWRSEDGGDSWEYVSLGLPSGLIGKIDFAVTPADPDRVYALVETKEPDEGLYRSDDAGRSWRLVSNHGPLMDRPFYYTNVDVDPTDADRVWVSATQFWFSDDGGESWERRSTPHGDNHDLWINPDDPRIMVQSNDGGAVVTRDGGETCRPASTSPRPSSTPWIWTTDSPAGCTRASRTTERPSWFPRTGRRRSFRDGPAGWTPPGARRGRPFPNPGSRTSSTPTARDASGATTGPPGRKSSTTWVPPTCTAPTPPSWNTASSASCPSRCRPTTRGSCTTHHPGRHRRGALLDPLRPRGVASRGGGDLDRFQRRARPCDPGRGRHLDRRHSSGGGARGSGAEHRSVPPRARDDLHRLLPVPAR